MTLEENLGDLQMPSYAERIVSDNPYYIQRLTWNATDRMRTDEFRRRQYQSLLAVDRQIGALMRALEDTGRLSNTAIIFRSSRRGKPCYDCIGRAPP